MRQPSLLLRSSRLACLLLVLHAGAQAAPEGAPAAVSSAPSAATAASAAAAAAAATSTGGAATAASTGAAAATNAGDAVLQLLQDSLLLPRPAQLAARLDASPVVQQMRDTANELVLSAMNFLGVRYRRGGNSAETGFDCSGFTRYVFEHSIGLVLPRRADQQATIAGLKDVRKEELRPGDLVFFNTMRRAFSHVGIYVGEGKFIHAPSAGSQVRVEDMRSAYWVKRFNGARRADLPAAQTNAQP